MIIVDKRSGVHHLRMKDVGWEKLLWKQKETDRPCEKEKALSAGRMADLR